MKIALYYPWIYLRSGCERTISEVIARSRHEWTVITNRYEPESTFPEIGRGSVVELARVPVERSFGSVLSAAWKIVRQKLPLGDCRALVVFCEGLGDLAVFRNRQVPVACLCFTPLRAVFDPHYQEHYLARTSGNAKSKVLLKTFGVLFRLVDRIAWKKYSRIFAISSEVKNRIIRGKLARADDVSVIYPGIDPRIQVGSPEYQPYFLIPGRIMWTKNLELAIEGMKLLLKRRRDLSHFRLIIAGFVDVKSRQYLRSLKESAAGIANIEFIEAPSDAELARHYERCYAVVYPPFNEDWGLVPLEAMLRSKAVIATNRGGPCETVIHGTTGVLVEPTPSHFAEAMETFADGPGLVAQMGASARVHVQQFDWRCFCEKLDNAIDDMLGVDHSAQHSYA